MNPQIHTYSDVIEALDGWLQARGSSAANAVLIRRIVQAAYEEFPSIHDWTSLQANGRIMLQEPYTTGTVEYDHTGGTYERQLTLTDGTWPDWAVNAAVRINDIVCDVAECKSSTVVTLDATMNPGADIAAGTTFKLYKRWYALPNDFVSFWGPLESSTCAFGTYISPSEMLWRDSTYNTTGDPRYYTIMPLQDAYGTLGLYLTYDSDATNPMNFIYKRRPRSIRYTGHDAADYAGTILVTAGSASVTGTTTSFSDNHVGSILRVSSSATTRPTGVEGLQVFEEQRSIVSVSSPTLLTLDSTIQTSRSGVKYTISDPMDIEVGAYQLFLALCKKHLAFEKDVKNKIEYEQAYRITLDAAKCGDTRVSQRRVCGYGTPSYARLADSPKSQRVYE